MSDPGIRNALEQFEVPPQSPTFFDDLWELVTARERAATARWRRISAVLAGIAIAALAAASVLAAPHGSGQVDTTVTCRLQMQGGLPVFDVGARPRSPERGKPPYNFTYPAELYLTTGGDVWSGPKLFIAQSSAKGYVLDRSACVDGGRNVPLAASGLPHADTEVRGYRGVHVRCVGPARVTVRISLAQNAKGEPTRALIAVRLARTGKPLAFVSWSAARVVVYAAKACDTGNI